jgi:hypothetical protein
MKRILILCFLPYFFFGNAIHSIGNDEFPKEIIYAHVAKDLTVAGEKIWFSVQAVDKTQKSFSKIIYAELINREGFAVYQTIYTLESGKAEGFLEIPTDLDSDHYLLRFYTRISPILGEKGVYNQFLTVIHPYKPPTISGTTANSYTFRNPNNLDTGPLSKEGQIQFGESSQAKIFENASDYSVSLSIKNHFLPQHLTGYIQGEIYKSNLQMEKLIPEPFGHIIHAKNLSANIDTSETFYLSVHGKQSYLSVAKPDGQGNLFFELGAMKDFTHLIFQARDGLKQLDVSLQSPFLKMQLKEDFHFPDLVIRENDRELLLDLVTAAKVNRYYYTEEPSIFLPIATGFASDRTYNLDDYVRFETVETTIREFVPEVYVRRQDKKTMFKVLDNALTSVFKENPLVLLDAMPVFDVDALAKFDPKQLQLLEVMNREFSLHQDKYAGVLSFRSYQNDFGGFPLPANALYLEYTKLQKSKKPQTVHLNPNIGKPHFPDFRTTLYWNSQQKIGDSLGFIPSSTPGNYQWNIVVSTGDGMMMYFSMPLD